MGLFDIFKFKKGNKQDLKQGTNNTNDIEDKFDLSDPDDVTEYAILQLSGIYSGESTRKDNGIFFPKWDVYVEPRVQQVTENGAAFDIFINAPQWDRSLYEYTVGMGSDKQSNIGMALSSFVFSFMQGVTAMEEKRNGTAIETEFSGNIHKWQVYHTDITGMGEETGYTDTGIYWNELKEGILKRLGNQKLCYVKIFASKMGDDVTGECRINDVASMELGGKVAAIARKWNVTGFSSQKQFFFIRQEEETTLANPYEGAEGFNILKEKVAVAAKMFHESETEEAYNSLPWRLAEALKDPVLAYECYCFLPEICTENAFPEAQYSENVQFIYPDGRKEEVYKSQLTDYELLKNALFAVFNDGVFGDETNDIYKEYVGSSATYNCFSQMSENGSDIKDAYIATVSFMADDGFTAR